MTASKATGGSIGEGDDWRVLGGYTFDMSTLSDSRIIDRMLDPVRHCLTLDVARQIASLRADASTQARLDELAEKSSAGTLSAEEASEYDAYLAAINFLGILQAKARAVLSSGAAA